ncbi:hypothetical protein NEUTE2DRAFT_70958, partial [Neurospora tetrasperma FGSC 2509]
SAQFTALSSPWDHIADRYCGLEGEGRVSEVAKDVAGGDEEGDKMMLLLMELVSGGIGGFDSQRYAKGRMQLARKEKRKEGSDASMVSVNAIWDTQSSDEGHQAKKIL